MANADSMSSMVTTQLATQSNDDAGGLIVESSRSPSAVEPEGRLRWPSSLSISQKLYASFAGFLLILVVSLYVTYYATVPSLINEQVRLRMQTLANTFSSAITTPLLTKDYLFVNQTALATAQEPGVAYVVVINDKGFPVAAVSSRHSTRSHQAFPHSSKPMGIRWTFRPG